MKQPRWIDAEAVRHAMSPDRARRLIRMALADGLDPAADPSRLSHVVEAGQLLVMPASTPRTVGVKVLSVAPDNPAHGLERIQALYVLMDAQTLSPLILIDGAALTLLRTPATSAVAMDSLAPEEVRSAVVFGSGPQATAHLEALLEIRTPERVTFVARDAARCRSAAQQAAGLGVRAATVTVEDRAALEAVVRASQVIVAATSSAIPVLDGSWVADGACVVAIGSHEPDRRELDASLMARSRVVVEDVATALREAGDVVLAVGEGALLPADLHGLADLVHGRVRRAEDRPNVFKSVGMAWQDLVIAEGVSKA